MSVQKPLAVILTSMLLNEVVPQQHSQRSSVMAAVTSCSLFPHYCFNIYSNDAPGNPAMENLLEALLDQPGFGTRCMEREEEDSV